MKYLSYSNEAFGKKTSAKKFNYFDVQRYQSPMNNNTKTDAFNSA